MSKNPQTKLQVQDVFRDITLPWGQKHFNRKLTEIWQTDPDYLAWACNVSGSKPRGAHESAPPSGICRLVKIVAGLERGEHEKAEIDFKSYLAWSELSQKGVGLDQLPRPAPESCRETLASCNVLGGHNDLDGLYSLAIAILHGGALGGPNLASAEGIRILNYHFIKLAHYTTGLSLKPGDRLVVIDFAAHPAAELTFDHHSTCLSFWEEGTPIPKGIFDTSIPSCPRLLATYCDFDIEEEVLAGCDRVDGAIYPNLAAALDLTDPFVAMEYCLGVDVTDVVRREVILTLAKNKLDPHSVLDQSSWRARLALVKCELEEQRQFWRDPELVWQSSGRATVIDARLAPHNASKFRFLPFEIPRVAERPYLVTVRGSKSPDLVNIGVGQNPFLSTYYEQAKTSGALIDVGALLKSLGQGGGRREVGSLTTHASELQGTLGRILEAVEGS